MNEVMAPGEELEIMQQCSINDLCRLCANLDDNMVPIYADEGANHMLETKIKTHLPFINICKNDVLPKRVCYHCASAVLVWNEVYESSSQADHKLRSMFESNPYDESNCKTVPFDDIEGIHVPVKGFMGESIEYEEISGVNIFTKIDRQDKTLNELDKSPSTSKTDNILSREHKSSVIQEDERLNPSLKSDMSNIFNRAVDDDDSEDNNIYLNAAGIDDDMNGLMNCHRLDMTTTDECNLVVPKREYIVDDEVEQERSKDDDLQQQIHCLNDGRLNATPGSHITDNDEVEGGDMENCDMDESEFKTLCQVKTEAVIDDDDDNDDDNDPDNDPDNDHDRCGGRDDLDDDLDDDDDEDESGVLRELYVSHPGVDNGRVGNSGSDGDCEEQETMCQICATVFKTRYNLLRHFQKRHPEFKMYECDLCRISFPSIDEFKDHLEEKHSKMHTSHMVDSKQVRFACDVCGNMYKNKASAMNHLLTHTAKKTVQCAQCDFSCYTKQQLGVHQTKHDKRFVCDICHKRFAQKSQLDVHVNAVHYNQRPYACVLCKKSFKTKGSHDAHMIVHTDTRNYQCPHCDKKCRKRYDLTLHIRTHTGEKPFKCSVCGRGFVQMCDTRKHEMLHFKPGKRKNVFFTSTENGAEVDDERLRTAVDDE